MGLDPVPLHVPWLHEGACPVCTSEYRADPEYWMALANGPLGIDAGLRSIWSRRHAEHGAGGA